MRTSTFSTGHDQLFPIASMTFKTLKLTIYWLNHDGFPYFGVNTYFVAEHDSREDDVEDGDGEKTEVWKNDNWK